MGISLSDLEYGERTAAGHFDGDRDMAERVVELVREFTGRVIDHESHTTNDGRMMNNFFLEDESENPLTIPEKAAVAAFAWYCREYTAGLKRSAKITFPKIIHAHSDDTARNFQHHLTFANEARAFQFAEVAERCFEVNAEVIGTPAGWAVVVSYSNGEQPQTDDNGLTAETLAMLQGACRVLCAYPVCAMDDAEADPMRVEPQESPEARQAWHDRKNAPLMRIESALGEILSLLGRNAATGAEMASADLAASVATASELLENIEAGAHRSKGDKVAAKAANKHTLPDAKPSPASKQKSGGKNPSKQSV